VMDGSRRAVVVPGVREDPQEAAAGATRPRPIPSR